METQETQGETIDDYVSFASSHDALKFDEARWNLVESLTKSCMAELGFDYPMAPYERPVSSQFLGVPPKRDSVAKYGWGIVLGYSPELYFEVFPEQEAVDQMRITLPTTMLAALHGRGGDGCRSSAIKRVQGVVNPDPATMDEYFARTDALRSSAAWIELDKQWESCMSDSGFSGVPRQADLFEGFNRQVQVLANSAMKPNEKLRGYRSLLSEERAMALAAFDCDAEIADQRRGLQAKTDAEFIAAHKTELLRAKKARNLPDLSVRAFEELEASIPEAEN